MVTDCYVLHAKYLDSAFRIFEESDVLDLVCDSEKEDHDQGEVDDICNSENDHIPSTDVKIQDAGYTDEEDDAIVTH